MKKLKNFILPALTLTIISFSFFSCGEDTVVDDWVGTYEGENTIVVTDLTTDTDTTFVIPVSLTVTAGVDDNTIIVSAGSETTTHEIDGDEAELAEFIMEREDDGFTGVTGSVRLDGDEIRLEWNGFMQDVDTDENISESDAIGVYTRQ